MLCLLLFLLISNGEKSEQSLCVHLSAFLFSSLSVSVSAYEKGQCTCLWSIEERYESGRSHYQKQTYILDAFKQLAWQTVQYVRWGAHTVQCEIFLYLCVVLCAAWCCLLFVHLSALVSTLRKTLSSYSGPPDQSVLFVCEQTAACGTLLWFFNMPLSQLWQKRSFNVAA